MAEAVPQLGYIVVFVPDVEKAVTFYEHAFGLTRRMVTPMFAQLDTGGTALAFGAEANEERERPPGFDYHQNRPDGSAAGIQVSLIAVDVEAAFAKAVSQGCVPVVSPKKQPWGQTVSRVRDLNGVLVSLVSPFTPPSK